MHVLYKNEGTSEYRSAKNGSTRYVRPCGECFWLSETIYTLSPDNKAQLSYNHCKSMEVDENLHMLSDMIRLLRLFSTQRFMLTAFVGLGTDPRWEEILQGFRWKFSSVRDSWAQGHLCGYFLPWTMSARQKKSRREFFSCPRAGEKIRWPGLISVDVGESWQVFTFTT